MSADVESNTPPEADLATPDPEVESLRLFGVPFHNVDFGEAMAAIDRRIVSREPGFVLTPNVDHVCQFQKKPELRAAYEACFLSICDGMPLLWASKLAGKPLKAKLSGSDMVFWLAEHAAHRGYRIFLLGAAEGVADEAAERLRERYPGIAIAGTYSPPMGFEKDPVKGAETLARVTAAKPDICYVAFGAPKQELWMHANSAASGVPVMLGIGASLDFVAGRVRRAPVWFQRAGLDWAWRLAQEPRRLAKRYLVDDSLFFWLVIKEMVRRVRA